MANKPIAIIKLVNWLSLYFKLGLIISCILFIVGIVTIGWFFPDDNNRSIKIIGAIFELCVATACISLALSDFIEGYVHVRNESKSFLQCVRDILGNILSGAFLIAGAVVLIIAAASGWN